MEAAVEITRALTTIANEARSVVDEWAQQENLSDPWAPEVIDRLEADYMAEPTEEKRVFLGYWIGEYAVRRLGHRWSLLQRPTEPFQLEFMVIVVNPDGSAGNVVQNFIGADPESQARLKPGWLRAQIAPERDWLRLKTLVMENPEALLPEVPEGVSVEIDRLLLSRSLGEWIPNQPVEANDWSSTPVATWEEIGDEAALEWARTLLQHTLRKAFKDEEIKRAVWRSTGVEERGATVITVTGLDTVRVTG